MYKCVQLGAGAPSPFVLAGRYELRQPLTYYTRIAIISIEAKESVQFMIFLGSLSFAPRTTPPTVGPIRIFLPGTHRSHCHTTRRPPAAPNRCAGGCDRSTRSTPRARRPSSRRRGPPVAHRRLSYVTQPIRHPDRPPGLTYDCRPQRHPIRTSHTLIQSTRPRARCGADTAGSPHRPPSSKGAPPVAPARWWSRRCSRR